MVIFENYGFVKYSKYHMIYQNGNVKANAGPNHTMQLAITYKTISTRPNCDASLAGN